MRGRARAPGPCDSDLGRELFVWMVSRAMHVIQGPRISRRVIGNSRLTTEEFDALLEVTAHALVGGGAAVSGMS